MGNEGTPTVGDDLYVLGRDRHRGEVSWDALGTAGFLEMPRATCPRSPGEASFASRGGARHK